MTSRTETDGGSQSGGAFCEIEGSTPRGSVYVPIWSDDLPWLIREVWSIMDEEKRREFLRDVR